MKKLHILHKPAKTSDLMFDDMHYELMDDDVKARAERLEARRWHLLRHSLRSSA